MKIFMMFLAMLSISVIQAQQSPLDTFGTFNFVPGSSITLRSITVTPMMDSIKVSITYQSDVAEPSSCVLRTISDGKWFGKKINLVDQQTGTMTIMVPNSKWGHAMFTIEMGIGSLKREVDYQYDGKYKELHAFSYRFTKS